MISVTDFACAVINMIVTNCSETQRDRAIRLTYLPNLRSITRSKSWNSLGLKYSLSGHLFLYSLGSLDSESQ